jgi:uncharacterized protein (TIGR04141 family)
VATFTVYLLRENIARAEDGLVAGARMHEVRDRNSVYGRLFVKQNRAKSPKWADLFNPYVPRDQLGLVQSAAAVFVVPVDGRLFALTFGQGRFLLHPDAYEERFGLVVTLNSIESDALRSLDKRAFVDDQNSRVQTSQAAAAVSFGLDIERDLVRGIVGKPTDAGLGTRLAGADALTVTADVAVPGLRRLLRRYLRKFASKDYQENFPWVDQVRQLIPKGEIATHLDEILVEKLKTAWARNGIVDDCWLAVPEIVDWQRVHGFKFTQSNRDAMFTDLHLPGLVQTFPEADPSLEFLKKRHAFAVDEDHQAIEKWPIYRCIHCEIVDSGNSYILSAGRWFEVDGSFVAAVDTSFREMTRYQHQFPIYNHKNEGEYNSEVVRQSNDRWCLMDKKLLRVGGIHDKVEFCDFYGQREIVHVKHYGSSSVLGHLFNQGLVSGELLKSHEEFIELANSELSRNHQLPQDAIQEKFQPRDVSKYSIIFGVISQSRKPDIHLPFFAKVVLKAVHSRLLDLGYGAVMICKISCHDDVRVSKLKRQAVRRIKRGV